MDRLTEKEKNGKYYIVEEKICIGTLQINPIRTWIVGNESRGYGNPIDRLGKLEDLLDQYNVKDLKELDKLLTMATSYEELSNSLKLLLFSKRRKLSKMFEKWCEENNADVKDTTNMITWLYGNNLLNVEEVEKLLKDKSE